MHKLFLILLIVLLIQSCSQEKVIDKRSSFILASLQESTFQSYAKGEDAFSTLKEIYEDKSSPHLMSRGSILLSHVHKIDSETANLISLIENMKLRLLKSLKQDLNPKSETSILLSSYNYRYPLRIAKYDFYQLKNQESTTTLSENELFNKNIVKYLRILRSKLCSEVVLSSNYENESKKFYFKDPKINSFTSQKDLNSKLDNAIGNSHIAPDDVETIKNCYAKLSFTESFLNEILSQEMSIEQAFSFLFALEKDILLARSYALECFRLRIANCGNFSATKILPVVIREETKADKGVYLTVFLAAINEDWNYTVEAKNTEIIESKDGVTLLKVKTTNGSKMKISGTISMANSYKVIKTLPWEKTITIQKNN